MDNLKKLRKEFEDYKYKQKSSMMITFAFIFFLLSYAAIGVFANFYFIIAIILGIVGWLR